MLVSFVIPHKGREDLLEQTIKSILKLEFDHKDIEVIICTQNESLESNLFEEYIVKIKKVFCPIEDTISTLRNKGVQNTSGEYLAFVDADIQLSVNWLNVMFDELKKIPNRVIVSCIQQCDTNAHSIEKVRVILSNANADSYVEFLSSPNLFISRYIFEKIGGFPEEMATCEDYYFTNKARELGTLYATSKASFIHLGEDKNYSELFQKEIWRSRSNLKTLKKRKLTAKEIPSIFTPLWQAFFIITFLFTLLFIKELAVALILLLTIFIPVLLYSIRLFKLGKNIISIADAIRFYSVYHAGRMVGTCFFWFF